MSRAGGAAVEAEIARIGRRIRRWREEAGLTLQELAERSGVAPSTIQKVESCQMVPSVAVLLKIARGLGRPPGDFVADESTRDEVALMREGDRPVLASRRGMRVERLSGDLPDPEVEAWRVSLEPGVGSGPGEIRYRGEELVLGESGTVRFRLAKDTIDLGPGDVLHFKSRVPHAWENPGPGPARFLVLGTLAPALREALHARRGTGAPQRAREGRQR